eukprot:CAMPEP_0119070990 /NCGR_PEP_ID=MMETSP1178-20130426/46592_1 /TAXON_ID=33656 /ORGANISM="unid sp, Strain CCMP2000" /LENGTH=34 /DNA_ID= /DNA_START= /DNA_END= /DNA_ORIENTATION=
MKQYYEDHFQALIDAKPVLLELKRGGGDADDKDD